MAHRIADELRETLPIFYDDSGAIGRRYRRQDEVGTPFGITVDGESLTNGTVTVRDRDTLKQERVEAGQLKVSLTRKLATSRPSTFSDCELKARPSWKQSRARAISPSLVSRKPRSCARSTRSTTTFSASKRWS